MNADERKSLAQQLTANPLFEAMLDEIETDAVERLVYAESEQDRVEAQWRVRSARSFRSDCMKLAADKPQKKGVVA